MAKRNGLDVFSCSRRVYSFSSARTRAARIVRFSTDPTSFERCGSINRRALLRRNGHSCIADDEEAPVEERSLTRTVLLTAESQKKVLENNRGGRSEGKAMGRSVLYEVEVEGGPDGAVFVARLVHARLAAHKRAPPRDNPLSCWPDLTRIDRIHKRWSH